MLVALRALHASVLSITRCTIYEHKTFNVNTREPLNCHDCSHAYSGLVTWVDTRFALYKEKMNEETDLNEEFYFASHGKSNICESIDSK